MTDTPIEPATYPPPSGLDQFKAFIGDLARPFAIISISLSCAIGLNLPAVASDKLGLALTALGAMFTAKTFEVRETAKQNAVVGVETAKQNAAVGVAQAQASAPGGAS